MKIIDEEKVKISANEFEKENGEKIWFGTKEGSPGTYLSVGSFKAGVSFSETKLQNLAVEFCTWYNSHGYRFDSVSKNFDKFTEQRNIQSEITDPLAILREDCYSNDDINRQAGEISRKG